ncbi:MAG TPA: protein translocase subunit SecD [Thermoleophilaceae bacterium]|jgi:SecD/SecF fusion protein
MTDKRRNQIVLGVVAGLLLLAALVIVPGSPLSKQTRLGLDLKGGVELVYQARPTPKVPKVTPQAIDDAINTIRKRTDQLGVSEPEIQRAGENEISIGLPDVKNAQRAEEQVGTTAQLQFYDWEPNVLGNPDAPFNDFYEAAANASKAKPRAEDVDVPPDGASDAVKTRFGNDQAKIRAYYDGRNDTVGDKYYLFSAEHKLIRPGQVGAGEGDITSGNDATAFYASCRELREDFSQTAARRKAGTRGTGGKPAKGTACPATLKGLEQNGPPAGSIVVKVPRGIVIVKAERPENATARTPSQYFVLEDDSELSGADIKDPKQNFDPRTNEPIVSFEFTDQGRKAFARVTKRIAERGQSALPQPGQPPESRFQRFAIALDGQIVSLATVSFIENPEGIPGDTGAQINGIGNIQQTQDLANNLRIGALPVSLKLISKTQVSATLGKQALNQGLVAGAAGLILTLTFLLLFYRVLGLVAGLALVCYAVLLFALVKLIPITLTLPGIAGLVLTLGVAADANIVIFERVKEEARAGRTIPAAIAGGYAKALRTIVDANVVTIGVAFILFMLATAGVKGFAFTLGVGTLVSLFTAVLATSAILGSMGRSRLLRSRHAIGIREQHRSWRFDFTGASKWFFSMSGAIIAAGALAIAGLGLNLGIDFESGTRITTPLDRSASVGDVRDSLRPLGYADAKIQEVQDPELGQNVVQIATRQLEPERVTAVQQTLDSEFGVHDFSSTSIGPTFGQQIAKTAAIAILASLVLISIYIGLRFEFKFAVPVLIALAHDLLITAGVYALTEREVTTSTVAALLTILGYSLYDTIIVFDRVRENVPRMPRATFSQIVNRSMSEVLTRSLVTSLSTLMPIAALMLFGGETLRDFGFALLVGVASGTYSSVFIASPVLTHWKEREPVYMRRRRIAMDENHGEVPPFADLGDAGADVEPDRGPTRRERAGTRRQRRARTGAAQRGAAGRPPEPAAPDQPAAGEAPVPERGAEETVAPVATGTPGGGPPAGPGGPAAAAGPGGAPASGGPAGARPAAEPGGSERAPARSEPARAGDGEGASAVRERAAARAAARRAAAQRGRPPAPGDGSDGGGDGAGGDGAPDGGAAGKEGGGDGGKSGRAKSRRSRRRHGRR